MAKGSVPSPLSPVKIGSRVHFVSETGQHLAAVVCKVIGGSVVNLTVDVPGEVSHSERAGVKYDVSYANGTWHWPEEVQ